MLECASVPKYIDTSSLDLNGTPFHLKYLQGSVNGSVGLETVALGPYAISNQALGSLHRHLQVNLLILPLSKLSPMQLESLNFNRPVIAEYLGLHSSR